MKTIEIPQQLLHGDYEGDPSFRDAMHKWVQQLWREKDVQIQTFMKRPNQNNSRSLPVE
jgi:hypothetical protein